MYNGDICLRWSDGRACLVHWIVLHDEVEVRCVAYNKEFFSCYSLPPNDKLPYPLSQIRHHRQHHVLRPLFRSLLIVASPRTKAIMILLSRTSDKHVTAVMS